MRNGNKYTLTFAAVQRGIHKLQVSIDIQPLKELTVSVIFLPDSLKKPKSVTTGLARPWGVVINSKGHLVVAINKDHWVCVFRKDGTMIQYFGKKGCETGQFRGLRGVRIDNRDNIYVADCKND